MPRELVQARCDEDITDALKHYADDRGISKSEAVRRMVRQGLARNGYEITAADGIGTAGEDIEEIRAELGEIERRQLEIAEQREQRIRRTWAGAAVAGVLYILGGLFTSYPPAFVAAGGVIVLAALALATHNLGMIEEEAADE